MASKNEFQDVDLTFIIPIRHQSNAKDWSKLKANLADTIHSISSQEGDNWRAVVVANVGADLPTLPPRFSTEWVSFTPNPLHDRSTSELGAFYSAIRLDKGRRIQAGMLRAAGSRYFMIVDEDDFISTRLSGFVANNLGQNGWYIKDGYLWRKGDALTFLYRDFSNFCGTSLIIRADLYALSTDIEKYSDEDIKSMLGSHVFITKYLAERGLPLKPLPFPGAVYNIGHAGSVSQSAGLIKSAFFMPRNRRAPLSTLKSIIDLRRMSTALREEFHLPFS